MAETSLPINKSILKVVPIAEAAAVIGNTPVEIQEKWKRTAELTRRDGLKEECTIRRNQDEIFFDGF